MSKSGFNATQAEVNRCKSDFAYFVKNYIRVKESNGTTRPLSTHQLSMIKRYSSYIKTNETIS